MKIFVRIAMAYIILGHIIAFIIAPYSSKGLEIYQIKDWVILIWGGVYIITVFFMWGYFFYHWGVKEFNNVNLKRMWFWIVLLGSVLYFIGPLAYYFFVYEAGKGLKKKSGDEK